jgi:hypothetical protein
MKMTNKQLRELEHVLYDLQRAYNYLQKPEIQGIARKVEGYQVNGGSYTINNPDICKSDKRIAEHIQVMDKEIGSDIAGFSMALHNLQSFIEMNSK